MDRTIAAVTYTEDSSTSVKNQYLAAVIVCTGTFYYGSAVGWLSPSLLTLQGEDSPLGAPLTVQELALVASLYSAGGLAGSLVAGVMADWIGRRWTGLIMAIPCILCWILKLTANSVMIIYFARLLAGFGGGGILLLAPMYSLEVGSLKVRGSLGSMTMLTINAGVFFAYVIGAYFPFYTVLWISLCVPLIYLIGFFFMPESPKYLVKREKYQEAAKSIAWLRNTSIDDPVTLGVLENLKQEALLASKRAMNSSNTIQDTNNVQNELIGTIQPEYQPKTVPDWKFFISSRASLKAFAMCFVVITIHVWVGIFAVLAFVSAIFAEAGSTLSPNDAAVVVGFLQLLGTIASILLVDRAGRKILFTLSCAILGLALATLGTYFYFKNQAYDMTSVGWIPVMALSVGAFMHATGVGPIPFVIVNEVFMVQAHGIAITILNVWLWVSLFLETHFYSEAESAMGSDGIFLAFSAVGILGAIYTIFFVPETKGKTLDEILQFFDRRSSRRTVDDGSLHLDTDNI